VADGHYSLASRVFDEDLIPQPQWQQHKERILRDADLPALAQPMAQMLQELETELEARYETVNRRILSGENTQIKLKQKNGETLWTLLYPSGEDTEV
jgi:hypothetical protein